VRGHCRTPHSRRQFQLARRPRHTTLAAVTYLPLGALIAPGQPNRSLKALVLSAAILITILVGFSRVYLGVHWPTDVLASWCLGAAWAALWWLVLLRLKPSIEGTRSANT